MEDFHKITGKTEKEKLSQSMKIFMDTAHEFKEAKNIVIGTKGTPREIISYDSELRNRMAEINVPLMSDLEITDILNKGEDCLNIKFFPSVKKTIPRYSNGLAAVCHQLALNSCVTLGLYETAPSQTTITQNDFTAALEKYVEDESDTTKAIFDKALRQDKKKKYDNFRLILEAIAEDRSEDGISRADIYAKIRLKERSYPAGNLTLYLNQLQSEQRGSIIRFDENSGKYSFANPFHKVFALAKLKKKYTWEDVIWRSRFQFDEISQYMKIKLWKIMREE